MDTQSPRDTKPLPAQEGWMQRLTTRRGMIILAIASVMLLVLAVLGAWYVSISTSRSTDIPIEITPPVSLVDLATEYPQLASLLEDPDLDSVYKDFLLVYQQEGPDAAYELARKRGLLNDKGEIRLTLELDTTDSAPLEEQLQAQDIKVTAASGNLIDIAIPLEVLWGISEDPAAFLQRITDLDHVVRVRVPYISIQDAGPVEIQSLSMIGAADWHAAGYTGEGITVAIFDGGFDGYRDLLGTDLPANVTVRSFVSGSEVDQMGSVHGTACAEIIHDIAPGAELYLVTAQTLAEFQQAIDWMLTQDIDIISHSAGWVQGPKDGRSTPAEIVDKVVESGILWVNSSGNYAVSHYRGAFTDDDGDGFHEFSPGDEMMYFEPEGWVKMVLNWDDWEVGDQDFDLYVVDADGNEVASSENTQNGPGDSIEMILYEFLDSGPYYLVFQGVHVTRSVTFDFYIPDTDIEYYSTEYSLNTPGDSLLSLTVGATNWEDDSLEYYSSQGPTEDDRLKPEISAPARVNTAAYGRPFYGTSASTPHVAGAAALVLQAYPDLDPREVVDFLLNRSLDYGPSGADYGFGYGRLWLGEPPGSETVPTPTQEQAVVLPSPTSGLLTEPAATQLPPTASTPKRRPTLTPAPESRAPGTIGVSLPLLACVVFPGLLGLVGLGLLGGAWFMNRDRRAARRKARPLPPPQAELEEEPQAGPQSKDICPRCGATHRMDASFCPSCGLSLRLGVPDAQPEIRCENCGHPLRSSSKFCSRCGHRT